VLATAAGRRSDIWGIVHNVTPHDSGRLSRALMGWFLRRLDRIIVHGKASHSDAVSLGCMDKKITVATLPSPWPPIATPQAARKQSTTLRALFFGTIRPYKGLDVLLEAMANVPEVTLTVAGEFWEDRQRYDELIDRLGIRDRVTIHPGYVPSSRFADVFGDADVLVLPYRDGTGSIVSEVGFRYGLPVIATRVGAIGVGIDNDTTGLLIPPHSPDALSDALRHAVDPETRKRWASGVSARQSEEQNHWDEYVRIVTTD
jgi:glycosyltransferase involved in cell wall biosynthesis